MTRRRRNSINIYDYPEHLNPFRDDVDDESDRFNTTGRRRSSFRAMFSGHKGKSKTSEDINPPPSQSAASRFMTWTPKLLRRSFRRQSPSRTTSQWDQSSCSAQISYRTSSNSRTSLPPSGSSHSSLHSSRSRSMLPPNSSLPPRPTSPPERPAPPNIRPQLSPQSTENAVNCVTTIVPSGRRALYTASSPEKPAGEKPTEDEVKYLQQGARPKKKRRAPLPPGPPPSKSPAEDSHQVNSSKETEASLTSSVTSSSTEEFTSHEQSVSASPDLSVEIQHPETTPDKAKPESDGKELPENSEIVKSSQQNVSLKQTSDAENTISDSPQSNRNKDEIDAQEKSENKTVEDITVTEIHNVEKKGDTSSITIQYAENDEDISRTRIQPAEKNEDTSNTRIQHAEKNDNTSSTRIQYAEKNENTSNAGIRDVEKKMEEKPVNGINNRDDSLENLNVDFNVVLHISEEDLKDKDPPIENGNHSESDVNHNMDHRQENGVSETDSIKTNSHVRNEVNEIKLHNGENSSIESDLPESETKLNSVNKKSSPVKTPEPKPRTILPTK